MQETSFIVNHSHIISEVFDNEVILMNLSDGMYYTLSGTAAEIWVAIEANNTKSATVENLVKRHNTDKTSTEDDVDNLISELLEESIILPNPRLPGAISAIGEKNFGPYTTPKLLRHTDMAEIMTMDPPLPEISAAIKSTP